MPDLPTITVNQEQADRMIAAYGSVANYKEWLAQAIREYVIQTEVKQMARQANLDQIARVEEINLELS